MFLYFVVVRGYFVLKFNPEYLYGALEEVTLLNTLNIAFGSCVVRNEDSCIH